MTGRIRRPARTVVVPIDCSVEAGTGWWIAFCPRFVSNSACSTRNLEIYLELLEERQVGARWIWLGTTGWNQVVCTGTLVAWNSFLRKMSFWKVLTIPKKWYHFPRLEGLKRPVSKVMAHSFAFQAQAGQTLLKSFTLTLTFIIKKTENSIFYYVIYYIILCLIIDL